MAGVNTFREAYEELSRLRVASKFWQPPEIEKLLANYKDMIESAIDLELFEEDDDEGEED